MLLRTVSPVRCNIYIPLVLVLFAIQSCYSLQEKHSPPCSPSNFHVAPMQGYTNKCVRALFRSLNSETSLWTEMEKVDDLFQTNEHRITERFGDPCTLQVGGSDPRKLEVCLKRMFASSTFEQSFTEVNLNCGCPSIVAGGAISYGASLMRQPYLTQQLVHSMRKAVPDHIPVSIKCRIAALDGPDDLAAYETEKENRCEGALVESIITDPYYKRLLDYVYRCSEAGASHVVVHARPAILSGLSPVQNRRVPSLDYAVVERLARDTVSSGTTITLNGGITTAEDLLQAKKTCPSVSSWMAGRWMLRRPLDLALAIRSSSQQKSPVHSSSYQDGHVEQALQQYFGTLRGAESMHDCCLPLFLVSEQLREDYDDDAIERNEADRTNAPFLNDAEMERVYETLVHGLYQIEDMRGKRNKRNLPSSRISFKKLSSSFKGIVGTKVVNKWKRNRAEL